MIALEVHQLKKTETTSPGHHVLWTKALGELAVFHTGKVAFHPEGGELVTGTFQYCLDRFFEGGCIVLPEDTDISLVVVKDTNGYSLYFFRESETHRIGEVCYRSGEETFFLAKGGSFEESSGHVYMRERSKAVEPLLGELTGEDAMYWTSFSQTWKDTLDPEDLDGFLGINDADDLE